MKDFTPEGFAGVIVCALVDRPIDRAIVRSTRDWRIGSGTRMGDDAMRKGTGTAIPWTRPECGLIELDFHFVWS